MGLFFNKAFSVCYWTHKEITLGGGDLLRVDGFFGETKGAGVFGGGATWRPVSLSPFLPMVPSATRELLEVTRLSPHHPTSRGTWELSLPTPQLGLSASPMCGGTGSQAGAGPRYLPPLQGQYDVLYLGLGKQLH